MWVQHGPNTTENQLASDNQKTKPANNIRKLRKSAKPPPPVQIRAAPPLLTLCFANIRSVVRITTSDVRRTQDGGPPIGHWVARSQVAGCPDDRQSVVMRRSMAREAMSRRCVRRGASGRLSSCRWTPTAAGPNGIVVKVLERGM